MLPFHRPDQHVGQLFYRDTAHAGGGTAMEMRVFGRTGMQLSVLGFGCGDEASRATSDPHTIDFANSGEFAEWQLMERRRARLPETTAA
jgi:hypothetical protein